VLGRSGPEVMRTSSRRRSQNTPSTHSGALRRGGRFVGRDALVGVDCGSRLHEHAPCEGNGPRKKRRVEPNGNAFADKVAIVTAAGSGMGAACARELAGRSYAVALMSTSGQAEALAKELGGLGLTGSVTEEADLEALVGKTLDRYGRIDGVVNSTGHPASGEVLELTDGQWHEALDLVVLNVVRIARLVTPAMLRQGGGAIVNVSTFSAFEPSPAFPLSSSLRAALAGFTKLYADRYAAEGVRMNNVLPGYIESFEIDDETRESIPIRRRGSVAEIAKTAAFLLSDDSGYITGQNIRVDGGLTRSV
jgi:NAD(P)-dependent dehydrogenase (short-subunit alcohol dehydrogenase family)